MSEAHIADLDAVAHRIATTRRISDQTPEPLALVRALIKYADPSRLGPSGDLSEARGRALKRVNAALVALDLLRDTCEPGTVIELDRQAAERLRALVEE